MATKSNETAVTASNVPDSVLKALNAAYASSKELIESSKSLLQSASPNPTAATSTTSTSSSPAIDAIPKLARLIHSHTVRTALTCGPTASSPTSTLTCIKDLHEPILPLVSEYQRFSLSGEYPAFYVSLIRREIMSLFDAIVAFLGEVVEIARGEGSVESRERLQYSGTVMEICDRLQRICGDGPIGGIRRQLKLTEDMLVDALGELEVVVEGKGEGDVEEEEEDGWSEGPLEYTAEQKQYAERAEGKLRFLSILYKAITKRRLPPTTTYVKSSRSTLDTVHECLTQLSVAVDDLVSGISAQEDPMTLELSFIQILDEGRKLATALRLPLNGDPDGRESWFDTWLEKMA